MKTGGRRESGFPAGGITHWYDQVQQTYSSRRTVAHIAGLLHDYSLLSKGLLQLGMQQTFIELLQGGAFGYLHPRVNGNVFETEESHALRLIGLLGAEIEGERQPQGNDAGRKPCSRVHTKSHEIFMMNGRELTAR